MRRSPVLFALTVSVLLVACGAPDETDRSEQTEQALGEATLAPGQTLSFGDVRRQRVVLSAQPGDLVEIVATGRDWLPIVGSYAYATAADLKWEDVFERTVNGRALRFLVRMRYGAAKMWFEAPDGAPGTLTVTARRIESGASVMEMFEQSPCEAAPSWTPADALARLGAESVVTLSTARVLKRRMYCGTSCDPWAFNTLSMYSGNDIWWYASSKSKTLGGATGTVVLRLRKDPSGEPVLDVDAEESATTPIWSCHLDTQSCDTQHTIFLPFHRGGALPDEDRERIPAGEAYQAQVRSGCFYLTVAGGNRIRSYNSLNPNPSDTGELIVTGTY